MTTLHLSFLPGGQISKETWGVKASGTRERAAASLSRIVGLIKGERPPWISQITSITLISPRKATYCLGLGQGGISISQLHLRLAAKNQFIFGS